MWVMTPFGFTSAVAHRKKKNCLLVRSRDELSLQYFCDSAGIKRNKVHTNFPSDYPYRVIAKRSEYAAFLLASAGDIEYDNFKTRAGQVRKGDGYVKFLHNVWADGLALTSDKAKRDNWLAWDRHDAKFGFGKYKKNKGKSGSAAVPTYSRWSEGGSWSGHYATPGLSSIPETLETESKADDDGSWPDVLDILDMTEDERADVVADMDDASKAGDVLATSILDELDELLPEDGGLFASVHAMTDAEFAEYEKRT